MSGERYHRSNQVYVGNEQSGSKSVNDNTLSTLYNPFSIRNNQPKWPDGLATFSIGRKQQFASELYGSEITIVLFPGSVNWCVGWDYALLTKQIAPHFDTRVMVQLNHGDDRTFKVRDFWRTTEAVHQHFWDFKESEYSAWRGVSYAMKVRCCNNDEENDGWFEAIRTSRNNFYDQMTVASILVDGVEGYQTKTHSIPGINNTIRHPIIWTGSVLPSPILQQHVWNADFDKTIFWESPSYCCGKLKDIGDYMFQLNPERDDNEFTKLRSVNEDSAGFEAYTITSYSYADDPKDHIARTAFDYLDVKAHRPFHSINDPDNNANNPARVEDIPNYEQSFLSDSFDTIILRIHGTESTRVLVHSVANIELLTGEFSKLAQFQTASYPNVSGLASYIDYRQTRCKLAYHTSDMYT